MASSAELDALSSDTRIPGGNVGEVYRLGDGRVLKILRRDLAQDVEIRGRFIAEASMQGRIGSRWVPTVFERGWHDERPYFVMSHVPGASLAYCLTEREELGEATFSAARVGQGVLKALLDCHASGVVHRDVKPDNVVVDPQEERVFLIDFGVACPAAPNVHTTLQLGSPSTWGPERLLGHDGADFRSDLFSAGVLMYTLVAGAHPFAYATPAWATLLGRCEVPPLHVFAPKAAHLDGFFRTALAKPLDARFVSASAMNSAWREACQRGPAL